MRARQALQDLRARRPAAFERATAIASGALVLIVSLTQWGIGWDSMFRGISLGVWLGGVVWYVARRRRIADERARQRLADQRLQLARELHDTVAGQVSVIGIQAAAARRVLTSRPDDAALALERIEAAGRAANADLRRMLEALRGGDDTPGTGADAGLAQLEELVASGGANRGPTMVSLSIPSGTRPVTDIAVDRTAYRIIQEGLTNARRHASDAPVAVDVHRDGGVLLISVVNGRGAQDGQGPGGGLGLVGIRERAALLGGSAEAGPTPDGGFAIHARLPLRPRP